MKDQNSQLYDEQNYVSCLFQSLHFIQKTGKQNVLQWRVASNFLIYSALDLLGNAFLQYIFFKISQTQHRAYVYFNVTCFSSILSHHQTFSKNDYTESLKLHLYTDLSYTCITMHINTHKYVKGWHIYIHLQCILRQRGVICQSSFKLPVSSFLEKYDVGSE
jgi:hypothetical protein